MWSAPSWQTPRHPSEPWVLLVLLQEAILASHLGSPAVGPPLTQPGWHSFWVHIHLLWTEGFWRARLGEVLSRQGLASIILFTQVWACCCSSVSTWCLPPCTPSSSSSIAPQDTSLAFLLGISLKGATQPRGNSRGDPEELGRGARGAVVTAQGQSEPGQEAMRADVGGTCV